MCEFKRQLQSIVDPHLTLFLRLRTPMTISQVYLKLEGRRTCLIWYQGLRRTGDRLTSVCLRSMGDDGMEFKFTAIGSLQDPS